SHPRRRARRQGPAHRQQQGRAGLLQQPPLAQVPLLGVVHLPLQRRRAPVPQQDPAPPAPDPPPEAARRGPWPRGVSPLSAGDLGGGAYLPWLRTTWDIVGIATSTSQLGTCRRRAEGRNLPLVLGEAEDLPFRDHRFDCVLSIGAFNYFNDPERALREMARVV